MNPLRSADSGFTLIEIIVTLTVAGILSVMLVQFIGTSLSRSAAPIISMQEGKDLQAVFENMNADYKRLLITGNAPSTPLKTEWRPVTTAPIR
jgi:prepilin-type N-terminal cleavage/methylation domain-containing protein